MIMTSPKPTTVLATSALMIPICAGIASAQCDAPMAMNELSPAGAVASSEFGYSVATSGNLAIIGARLDSELGTYAGSAYIFRRVGSTWVEEAKLMPSDGAAWDQYGNAVAISGNVAVVGSYLDDDNGGASGSAYVYHYTSNGWVEAQKLIASDGVTADLFGVSVAVSGNNIMVGAEKHGADGYNAGAAYAFRFDAASGQWVEHGKLMPHDGFAGKHFGCSVSLDGDVAAIGAYFDIETAMGAGAAYVFRNDADGWYEEAKLLADDGASLDLFGTSVSISGDAVLVGSFEADVFGPNSGAAYVFRRNAAGTWYQEQQILASDGSTQDKFGCSVSLCGNKAVIGAFWDDPVGDDSGSAYTFQYNPGTGTWNEQEKLSMPTGQGGDQFGRSVAVFNETVAVGAYQSDSMGTNSGAACVFSAGGSTAGTEGSSDCNGNGVPDTCEMADGSASDCNGNGLPDECDIDGGHDSDFNGNGVPDGCETIGDVDGNGMIDVDDLIAMIISWGMCPLECPADLDGDGDVDIEDVLVFVFAADWS